DCDTSQRYLFAGCDVVRAGDGPAASRGVHGAEPGSTGLSAGVEQHDCPVPSGDAGGTTDVDGLVECPGDEEGGAAATAAALAAARWAVGDRDGICRGDGGGAGDRFASRRWDDRK